MAPMEWRHDPVLGGLWAEPVPAMPSWERVSDALVRGGATVMEMPGFHLVVYRTGRVARFQDAAGRMWRYQARMLRNFLDDAEAPPRDGGGGGGLWRRGWVGAVGFDGADGLFTGWLLGTFDVVGFHAENVKLLLRTFERAVDDYESAFQTFDRPVPKPMASGGLRLRMRPRAHHYVAQAAAAREMSLNAWLEDAAYRMARAELLRV